LPLHAPFHSRRSSAELRGGLTANQP
jgi:hypothetical protein